MRETIPQIICKTGNFSDGQKIIEAVVIYENLIDPASVNQESFSVRGRTVERTEIRGREVHLCLREKEPYATVLPTREEERQKADPAAETKMCPLHRRKVEVWVQQRLAIRTAEGAVLPPWPAYMPSTYSQEPVVEEFQQGQWDGLKYSLFIPQRGGAEKYPLVVFLHDARPRSDDPKVSLSQGNGGITWAEKAWQQDHPAFVLVPQFPADRFLANDEFEVSEDLERTFGMIRTISAAYPVDPNRIYLTGQSMGCMANCELLVRYGETFAGALLAAGQWSPERMAACKSANLWVLVSEHDVKAFPGMNSVMQAMESAGGRVARSVWDAKSTTEELNQLARELAPKSNLHYTVFAGSSVVPDGEPDHPGSNHEYTWRVVYSIDGLKEWLFQQKRTVRFHMEMA